MSDPSTNGECAVVVFRRDEWVRYWQQPSVGGTEHGYHAPEEMRLVKAECRFCGALPGESEFCLSDGEVPHHHLYDLLPTAGGDQ